MPFIEVDGKRVLFIHIPKTGGTSVEAWLRTQGPLWLHSIGGPAVSRCTPQHYRLADIEHVLGEGYFDYAFAIVRDPYERLASEYKMRAAQQESGFWKVAQPFSYWAEVNLAKQKDHAFQWDNHLRPQ